MIKKRINEILIKISSFKIERKNSIENKEEIKNKIDTIKEKLDKNTDIKNGK